MKKIIVFTFISAVLILLAILISFMSVQTFNQNQNINTGLNLEIQTVDGSTTHLSNFVGQKSLILDLFATWCVPCKEQADLLQHVHTVYPDVTIISVSVDLHDTASKLLTYQQRTNISWTLGTDIDSKANQLYGSYVLPTLAFFNENGTLLHLKHSVATFSEISSWITNPNQNAVSSTFYIFGLGVSSTIGFPLFFFVGLYVALSPCLFPIMPITILNIMRKQEEKDSSEIDSSFKEVLPKKSNLRMKAFSWIFMLWSGILFSFGIFALIGVFIGSYLIQNYLLLNLIFGIILIIMGYIILSPKLEEIFFARIPIPDFVQKQMQKEEYSGLDLFTLGAFYSIIALPCSGPVFIALIPLIISFNNQIISLFSLSLFAIGLLLPYLLLIMVTTETQSKFIQGVRNHYNIVKIITGILIILVGGLLAWPYFGGPILFTVG